MITMLASLSWPEIGLRAGVVACALAIWFWTQSLIAGKAGSAGGIGDLVHDLTAHWHRHLQNHPGTANAVLIISSLFIDLIGLALIAASILGPTFAPFLGVLILFGLRQISQGICTLPPPPGIIWHNPGFPALLVTYQVGNDFFFSGHTALAVLGALQAAALGPGWLAATVGLIAVGEMLVVLVLRAHYTMDVITGVLAACVASWLAERIAPWVDWRLGF